VILKTVAPNLNFKRSIQQLRERLQLELPGPAAQLKMAPGARGSNIPSAEILAQARRAAVLILLYEKNGELYFPIIKRVTYPGVHSGQMAFPGGTYDEVDGELRRTAFRETEEEVGIPPSELEFLAALSPLYIPPSKFYVEPYVAIHHGQPQFIKEIKEVDQILEVPLSEIINPSVIKRKIIQGSSGWKVDAPYYDVQGEVVWGATATIIAEFLELFPA